MEERKKNLKVNGGTVVCQTTSVSRESRPWIVCDRPEQNVYCSLLAAPVSFPRFVYVNMTRPQVARV